MAAELVAVVAEADRRTAAGHTVMVVVLAAEAHTDLAAVAAVRRMDLELPGVAAASCPVLARAVILALVRSGLKALLWKSREAVGMVKRHG